VLLYFWWQRRRVVHDELVSTLLSAIDVPVYRE
jgi:hypothetical protein